MSNKKICLYDNGFVFVSSYAFSEDKGKLLENLPYPNIRRHTKDI